MYKIGLVGGTGYTGAELMRLLVNHPQVKLHAITSRTEQGIAVADMFPSLRGFVDLCFTNPSIDTLAECDLVFFATPNGVAMKLVPELLKEGIKIVDLAADFRLHDPDVWEQWYGCAHTCPEVLQQAVYGLPEVNRELIKKAQLVANPGCYPTAVQLGFLPLIEQGLADISYLIADAKSGVSGAGRGVKVGSLLCEASENMAAYGVTGHRHLPEISQGLQQMAKGQPVGLTFVPHLTPMIRGIHATLYTRVMNKQTDLQALFEQRFADEPFVDVLPQGEHPHTRTVKGTNTCRMAVHRPQNGEIVVVLSAIDNLVKGAAGQAIQNMNIMLGIEEAQSLLVPGLMP
ncbi:N-acetyl-gamma-glutamyl-phosphate reductase [Spartinivicinus poritis]|uniref:N-acetyl-gamma-glutamyl-phosphate reductase n=1 Tax=Spartinivicinus poritis TaxID=2994640 RepID=A0ABT5UCG0_9GAMM|nr:N-acetyl-gamma-glutamyl-phosphate reductase [Spartinivicinus sp. A2-2]MDE1463197.1 N-acetyl-gamma-glutamyl-phosphate reductase [Spartinivicinus sp. A2-2]